MHGPSARDRGAQGTAVVWHVQRWKPLKRVLRVKDADCNTWICLLGQVTVDGTTVTTPGNNAFRTLVCTGA